ncbi:hypothetical protein BDZ89DRAFT_1129349 [Hymenopellis radicata]|nr:hypothetical protein BDZ89DRAFT_1129349 [Hymenopellis radicata]
MSSIDGFKTEKPFQELIVTPGDLTLGSIVYGFFFGFAILVTWTAVQETRRAPRFSAYIFMVWLEIVADICLSVLAWSYLAKIIPPSVGLFTSLVFLWVCQVQCLMLIIANRLCILYSDERQRRILRFTTAGIVTVISFSTACVWIPAQLQINHTYIWLNHWWDRFEKSVYLLLDLTLNILFIRVVKTRLVNYGLTKYDRVMKFNEYIIFVSISMDILLLGVTALHNPFVYVQFHPVVYIVKLQIEMTMSRLLIKVARSTGISVYTGDTGHVSVDASGNRTRPNSMQVRVDTQVFTTRHTDDFGDHAPNRWSTISAETRPNRWSTISAETRPRSKYLSGISYVSGESSAGPSA